MNTPELSIIIPVYNEGQVLSALFTMLASQQDVSFEVVLCDGGSVDGTASMALKEGKAFSFPVRVVNSEKGRGRQMNQGAVSSTAETLLFLHTDSFFKDPFALRKALDCLSKKIMNLSHKSVAGHFPLYFERSSSLPSFGYFYYESKARLNRKECIHGDQGFLLRRSFFEKIGPFDESLPFLEDNKLAKRIFQKGKWILLPDDIFTSARRFEKEGLFERQLINAITMNFFYIGWDRFLQEVPAYYRSQDKTGRLQPGKFFEMVKRLFAALPIRQRLSLWYASGKYVCSNAWQIAFAYDMWRSCKKRTRPGEAKTPALVFFDRYLAALFNSRVVSVIGTILLWIWFHAVCVYYKIKS